MAPSGHRARVATSETFGSPDRLFSAWQQFVALLGDAEARPLIGTAEAVEALLARSGVQRALEGGAEVDLGELAEIDEQYRRQASTLLESTRVTLYGADEPVTDWWWRVNELAAGPADNAFLDVAAAAQAKRVHPHTVRAAIHAQVLPARRLGRSFLIHQRDLARWQPRSVGRPATAGRREGDELLAAFNAANTRENWERAHAVANLLAERPTTGRRCLALALDAFNAHRYDDSLSWVGKARQLGLDARGRVTAAITASSALMCLDRPKSALSETEGIEPPPDLEVILAGSRVDAWVSLADLAGARSEVERALRRLPGQPEPHLFAARVEFHGGDLVRALEHIVLYRDLVPEVPEGLMLHGSILGKLGDALGDQALYKQALVLFRRARAHEDWRAVAKIALSLARLGRWKVALRLGRSLSSHGQTEAVEEILRASLRAAAATDDSGVLLSAVAVAERWIGATAWTGLYRAFALATSGDWTQAVHVIDSIPDDRRDPVGLRLLRVTALLAANRTEDALVIADQLPLTGSPIAALPDLLQLRVIQERQDYADERAQIDSRDEQDKILSRLAGDESPMGLLAGLWLATAQADSQREAEARRALVSTASETPGAAREAAESWDVYHRLLSSSAKIALLAA